MQSSRDRDCRDASAHAVGGALRRSVAGQAGEYVLPHHVHTPYARGPARAATRCADALDMTHRQQDTGRLTIHWHNRDAVRATAADLGCCSPTNFADAATIVCSLFSSPDCEPHHTADVRERHTGSSFTDTSVPLRVARARRWTEQKRSQLHEDRRENLAQTLPHFAGMDGKRPSAYASRPRCPACQGLLERSRPTVLDNCVAELWWCMGCRMWWGELALSEDTRQDPRV